MPRNEPWADLLIQPASVVKRRLVESELPRRDFDFVKRKSGNGFVGKASSLVSPTYPPPASCIGHRDSIRFWGFMKELAAVERYHDAG